MARRAAIALALGLAALLSTQARAWNPQGHRIAAAIAEQYLAPATAEQVRALLAIESAATLADVSTWADDVRGARSETAGWDFVDIPVHPPAGTPNAYDVQRDCPQRDCIVAAIERFQGVLGDKAAPPRERLEALKFLVHFIADLHQPLHCADDGDHSGSETRIEFLGQHTTLYMLWDSAILEAAGIADEPAYARQLAEAIAPAQLTQWRGGTPAGWATESYRIARLIYGGSHEARALQIFYQTDFLPVVNTQLEKAGVRLASALNAALP